MIYCLDWKPASRSANSRMDLLERDIVLRELGSALGGRAMRLASAARSSEVALAALTRQPSTACNRDGDARQYD
jgi:hypothetical protein